jgi:hypothetical protein
MSSAKRSGSKVSKKKVAAKEGAPQRKKGDGQRVGFLKFLI